MIWIKIGLVILVLMLIISLIKAVLRKVFYIEKVKKSLFSYDYINQSHKKIDRVIRMISFIVYIVILYLLVFKEYSVIILLATMILLTTMDYLVRAAFEWRYSENPKQAILTLSEMSVLVLALVLTIQFDLLSSLFS